jgi:hypothetical protein
VKRRVSRWAFGPWDPTPNDAPPMCAAGGRIFPTEHDAKKWAINGERVERCAACDGWHLVAEVKR